MKFSAIVTALGDGVDRSSLDALPDLDPDISEVAPIETAASAQISYIEGQKYTAELEATRASALILPVDEELWAVASAKQIAWIAARDPRWVFARTIALFYQPFRPQAGIHPTATIAPDATLGADVFIGANAVIGAGVKIADGACIHANVAIYPQVKIGPRTVLHANCTIHERSQIGADCVVHSGVVIGAEGFGFVPTPSGWFKMEQSGVAILEDGVEIGANSTVDRPAVGETRIGSHTKIDNLVQVGHGCKIGSNCAIAAQVGLAGGVTLGNNVILAGQVGVANRAKVGDGAIASAKTGIHQDVRPGAVMSGFPAVPNRVWLKCAAIYKRLPEVYQLLRQLSRQQNFPEG